MKTELEQVLPQEIEKRSFEIITEELGDFVLTPGTEPIVKRCIHTSADFDYAKNLVFSDNAVQKSMDAIRDGAWIITDTQMGMAGINKKVSRYPQYAPRSRTTIPTRSGFSSRFRVTPTAKASGRSR